MQMDPLFKQKYEQFVEEYDKLMERDLSDSAQKLESLGKRFLAEHKVAHLDKIPYYSLPSSKFPDCTSTVTNEEEMQLFSCEIDNDAIRLTKKVPEEGQICADIYRRLAQAAYMNSTLDKLRNPSSKLDRYQAVEFARIAIRYNILDFEAILIYSMSMGWYLDAMGHGFEKVRNGRSFYRSLTYNIRLNPKSGLAHHIIGRYYFNVSQLSWIERALASKLFESEELSFSASDSERALRLAHSLDPCIAATGLWMARALQAQKKTREQIVEWIELGLKAKSREPINDIERAQLEEFKRKGKY